MSNQTERTDPNRWLAEFLGIDQLELSKEKQAMLDALREANAA